jgi:hypothetical protein
MREFLDGPNRAGPLVVGRHYVLEFRPIYDMVTVLDWHGHYLYRAVSGSDRVFSAVFSAAIRPGPFGHL